MKPYGRHKKVRYPGKTDCHPKKGWMNWWEDMCKPLRRSAIKRLWKRNIEENS